jgi:predicted enzyme related to lactoylglutathione lyase
MMSNPKGNFVWYELRTVDAQAAQAAAAFYSNVVGWNAQDSGMPGTAYTIFSADETPVGGLMVLPPEACAAGARPGWMGYIGVDDVDSFAARVTGAGGSVHRDPDDIPSIGRFAVAADPQGAMFVLFKGVNGAQPQPPTPGTPGHTGWHELHAANWENVFPFYATLFGWTKAEAMNMGPMGVYQIFAAGNGAIGGMMSRQDADAVPSPAWLYYFNIEDIAAATARVKHGGGALLNGPHEVPGGSWIVQCRDPQGILFALVGPRG